jgi:hypothetical protein
MVTEKSIVLDKGTLVPVGVAAAAVMFLASATFWLQGRLSEIDRKLERIDARVQTTWDSTSMENWALRLARENPSISVPEVR